MFKKENGITLVALVVTIIVLLILAGVSITMISGDDGIATRASDAKTKTDVGNATDAVNLAVSSANADYYSNFAEGKTAVKVNTTALLDTYLRKQGYAVAGTTNDTVLANNAKFDIGAVKDGSATAQFEVTVTMSESGLIVGTTVKAK